MPVVAVTRFRLRSANPIGYGLFAWHTLRSGSQAERAPGFLAGELWVDGAHTFWTATVWADERSVRGYRGSGSHRRAMHAMKILDRFCDEAATVAWEAPSDTLPDPDEMCMRLSTEGAFFRLTWPSPAHEQRAIAAPRMVGGRALRPRGAAEPNADCPARARAPEA